MQQGRKDLIAISEVAQDPLKFGMSNLLNVKSVSIMVISSSREEGLEKMGYVRVQTFQYPLMGKPTTGTVFHIKRISMPNFRGI